MKQSSSQVKKPEYAQSRKDSLNLINDRLTKMSIEISERHGPFRRVFKPRYLDGEVRVIIGDSLVYGLVKPNAVTISLPGATVEKLFCESVLLDLNHLNPKKMFVLIGTNNLGRTSPKSIANELIKFALLMKENGTQVGIVKIPHRETYKNERDLTNSEHTHQCFDAGIQLIIHKKFRLSKDMLVNDLLHPSAEGVRKLACDLNFDLLHET